jgi:hypothetical protein
MFWENTCQNLKMSKNEQKMGKNGQKWAKNE